MKGLQQFIWDFLFELFLSIRLSLSVILFYIKFGTHGNMIIVIKLHPINPLNISNQAK